MKFSIWIAATISAVASAQSCWKQAYGRGAGSFLNSCLEGNELNGALCYPICRQGYYGVGPVCWQACPPGFPDDGAFCRKPDAYGRGAGYVLWQEGRCNSDNPAYGCERYGLIWYPRCRPSFHNEGCCICSPDCPPESTDIGVSC